MILGAKAFDELLRQISDFRHPSAVAKAAVRRVAIGPDKGDAKFRSVPARLMKLPGSSVSSSRRVGRDFGERGLAGAFLADDGHKTRVEGNLHVVKPAARLAGADRADNAGFRRDTGAVLDRGGRDRRAHRAPGGIPRRSGQP